MWVTREGLAEHIYNLREAERGEYHYRIPWGTCVLCRVRQFAAHLDDRHQCVDKDRCLRWCRDSLREWVEE